MWTENSLWVLAFNTHSQIHRDNNNKYITRTYFISHTSWEFFENAFIAVTYTKGSKEAASLDKMWKFCLNFYWFMISKQRHTKVNAAVFCCYRTATIRIYTSFVGLETVINCLGHFWFFKRNTECNWRKTKEMMFIKIYRLNGVKFGRDRTETFVWWFEGNKDINFTTNNKRKRRKNNTSPKY